MLRRGRGWALTRMVDVVPVVVVQEPGAHAVVSWSRHGRRPCKVNGFSAGLMAGPVAYAIHSFLQPPIRLPLFSA